MGAADDVAVGGEGSAEAVKDGARGHHPAVLRQVGGVAWRA